MRRPASENQKPNQTKTQNSTGTWGTSERDLEWMHPHILSDLEKDWALAIEVFVVSRELLKLLGHESVPRRIPRSQNGESKDNWVSEAILPRNKKKKRGNSAFLASPKRVSLQVPTHWRSHSHIFPPFLVPLNHKELILVSYLQNENGLLKSGQRLLFWLKKKKEVY